MRESEDWKKQGSELTLSPKLTFINIINFMFENKKG
jgi:hypothetical protein